MNGDILKIEVIRFIAEIPLQKMFGVDEYAQRLIPASACKVSCSRVHYRNFKQFPSTFTCFLRRRFFSFTVKCRTEPEMYPRRRSFLRPLRQAEQRAD
ncbi:hypothetical protein TNCV_1439181 [Trichonephila clavipes]|nr:hypothetical protein TNCV_1439181 [Trichonephila clavipes]